MVMPLDILHRRRPPRDRGFNDTLSNICLNCVLNVVVIKSSIFRELILFVSEDKLRQKFKYFFNCIL